jgi:3-oxoadipate enol-lactonase
MPYLALPETDSAPALAIRYEIHGDRPGAETLLLVHELGGTLASWRALAERLAPRFRVVAFDQRGAGLSEKPTVPFTLWDLADDIARVADALGIDRRFALMGLAMGAVTAAHFAARHPDRLAALVLCDGTPSIDERSSKYLLDRAAAVRRDGMRAVADMSFRNAFRGLEEVESNGAWQEYRQRFIANAPVPYAMQSEALAAFVLGDEHFASIRVRTLVLTGRHDFIWPPEVGRALAARLPNAEFDVVERAAHFPPIQDADGVAERVTRFLADAAS